MSPEVVAIAVKAYFAALRAMDQQAWVNTFAEDAVSHDPVGAPPINGHQKLGEFFQTITAAFKEVGLTEDQVCQLGTRGRSLKNDPGEQSQRFGTQFQRSGNVAETNGGRAK